MPQLEPRTNTTKTLPRILTAVALWKYNELSGIHGPDLLQIDNIAPLRLTCAQLAYLSACPTGDNGSVRLADEVLHLASGFQMAGSLYVIGSIWPSVDHICAEVARVSYQKAGFADLRMVGEASTSRALQKGSLVLFRSVGQSRTERNVFSEGGSSSVFAPREFWVVLTRL